jgi:hypothetical protein
MEGWIVAASFATVAVGLIAACGAVWLGVLNRQLVQATQAQVRASQEDLRNQQRPVLVPVGAPTFQREHENWLKWEESEQPLSIRNVGQGTAYNVASVLHGCASYLHDISGRKVRDTNTSSNHWTRWLGVPIAPGETVEATLKVDGSKFAQGNREIGGYSLNAPDEPEMAAIAREGALWRVARVMMTYHDISGRKYASIIDYVMDRGWHMVANVRDLDHDLGDLEGFLRPVQVREPAAEIQARATSES